MPAEGRENPLLKKGNSDAFFREKYLTKNSCGHTPGKVAGQRATVKAEMNGVTPGLDRRPPPRWMGGQGGQSLKVLGRALSDFEVFSFSKLNNQNKFFRLKKFYLLSSSMPYFFFCRIT